MVLEEIGRHIVHSAIKVHKALGPGLLESVYQKCLTYELEKVGLPVKCEALLPVRYEEMTIDAGFRGDMIVGNAVINSTNSTTSWVPQTLTIWLYPYKIPI